MIAPAMNTRPQEALLYRDLARQQVRLSRQIDLQELPRVAALMAPAGSEPVSALAVTLQFSFDSRGYCRVQGTVSGELPLRCHGCAEDLAYPFSLPFGCFIAEGEALAAAVVGSSDSELPDDVLVATGPGVSVAEIIEDEILLALPERLCRQTPCPRAPMLEYPAAGQAVLEAAETASPTGNPFSVLAGLETDDER